MSDSDDGMEMGSQASDDDFDVGGSSDEVDFDGSSDDDFSQVSASSSECSGLASLCPFFFNKNVQQK